MRYVRSCVSAEVISSLMAVDEWSKGGVGIDAVQVNKEAWRLTPTSHSAFTPTPLDDTRLKLFIAICVQA